MIVLPAASLAIVAALLASPEMTGFAVGVPGGRSDISANVSIRIAEDGFVPDGSLVTVDLDGRSASMDFGEFVGRSGASSVRILADVPAIDYSGYGYGGPHAYSLGLEAFGIGTDVAPGRHVLTINVSYGNFTISSSSQDIEA